MDKPIVIHDLDGIIEQSILQALDADPWFVASATFREQCHHACRVLRQVYHPAVPWVIIGKLMGIDQRTVRCHRDTFAREGNDLGSGGREPVLSEKQMNLVVNFIVTNYRSRTPQRLGEVRKWIHDKLHVDVVLNTLSHILAREPRIRPCRASPMDSKRYSVTNEEIMQWYQETKAKLDGIPAHFIFNMDEMGHAVWADAKDAVCYVPADVADTLVHYPVSRVGKRITLVAAIAMDGSFLKPSMIISRKTWDDELVEEGLTGEKIEIYDQENAFINMGIFEDWFKDTFVPEVQRRRQLYGYTGTAFLIMDNCTTHAGQDYEALALANQIEPIWLPPHASNQLQMLDLSIFGITKRKIARVNQLEQVNIQTDHIVKVVNSFMSAAVPHNIIKAFRNAGFTVKRDANNHIFCLVTPETARCLLQPLDELPEIEEQDPNVEVFVSRCARLIGDAIAAESQ